MISWLVGGGLLLGLLGIGHRYLAWEWRRHDLSTIERLRRLPPATTNR